MFGVSLCVAVLVAFLSRRREPTYEGKPLSHWLKVYWETSITLNGPHELNEKAEQAIQTIGTNGIPLLLEMLQVPDRGWRYRLYEWSSRQRIIKLDLATPSMLRARAAVGFEVLGPSASNAVPDLVSLCNYPVSSKAQYQTIRALKAIGPAAASATDVLLEAGRSTNTAVRGVPLSAISVIVVDPSLAVPELMAGLNDPSPEVKMRAAVALARYGTNAHEAVSALIEALQRSSRSAISNASSDFLNAVLIDSLEAIKQKAPDTEAELRSQVGKERMAE